MAILQHPYLVVRKVAASSLSTPPSRSLSALFPRSPSQLILSPGYRFSSSFQPLISPPAPPKFKKQSLLRRVLGFSVIAGVSFAFGFSGIINKMLAPSESPVVNESGVAFAKEVDEYITTHPLAQEMRANPQFKESRPHKALPEQIKRRNLTAGTLAGTDKIVVPPYIWSEEGGKSLVSMFYLGPDVCGHSGIVHGGLLATLLDEGLARCCFPALPNKIGVTANLNIDYRSPARAGSYFVLRANTTKVDGRKAWVEGWIETLPQNGEDPVILVEAKALFVEPKNAGLLPRLLPVVE